MESGRVEVDIAFIQLTTTRELVRVTGITMSSATDAVVEYIWVWQVTELGAALRGNPTPYKDTAPFKLWDDGWRLNADRYIVGGKRVLLR